MVLKIKNMSKMNDLILALRSIFDLQSAEKQAEILAECRKVIPSEKSRLIWKIGAAYYPQESNLSMSFAWVMRDFVSDDDITFDTFLSHCFTSSSAEDLAKFAHYFTNFLRDAKAESISMQVFPFGFVEGMAIADFALAGQMKNEIDEQQTKETIEK